MIVIVDYGRGNLRSVLKGFIHAGVTDVVVSSDATLIASADALVIPGVGAFSDAMDHLQASGLIEPLRRRIEDGVPTLGICLGMQLMFDASKEHGNHKGLGLLGGTVVGIEPQMDLKIPHMGWNTVHYPKSEQLEGGGGLFRGIADETAFYFVHSYHCVPNDRSVVTGVVEYGSPLVCAVQHENIYAVQFHPEKSSTKGLQILSNFGRIAQRS